MDEDPHLPIRQVVDDDMGHQQEVDLVPNGANIPVTNSNKIRYVNLVAKHHIYDRIRLQSEAFCRGFHDVIRPSMLQVGAIAEASLSSPSHLQRKAFRRLRCGPVFPRRVTLGDGRLSTSRSCRS